MVVNNEIEAIAKHPEISSKCDEVLNMVVGFK
jgi:hypothetical protein